MNFLYDENTDFTYKKLTLKIFLNGNFCFLLPVSDRSTFRAFRITMAITLARELCGCLAVLHFAAHIFSQAGGGWVLSANQQAAVLGAVQLVGSCTASSLVERTGRKVRQHLQPSK